MEKTVTLEAIQRAATYMDGEIIKTPCLYSPRLSELASADIYLKLENRQRTGSYKERGAFHWLRDFNQKYTGPGVIAFSAGNHAQGVAYHAQKLGIPATIVMPASTPLIKVTATKRYGARVVLAGHSIAEAKEEAWRLVEEEGWVMVHPFDDPKVIIGQGTVALEILEQVPEVDEVFVPIGGGGLISGMAVALKATRPEVTLVGVEAAVMPAMARSVTRGARMAVPSVATLADGIAVAEVGALCFELVKPRVDAYVAVDEEAMAAAILTLLELDKIMVEGAAAAAVAAVLKEKERVRGKRVVVVVTGGNLDVTTLARVIDRGLVARGRLARLSVTVKDEPGVLAELTAALGKGGANILQIRHERAFMRGPFGESALDVTVETRGPEHLSDLVEKLRLWGFEVSVS